MSEDPLYAEAIESAALREVDGQPAYFMLPQHLAAIALKTGRLKDYQRVAEFIAQSSTSIAQITELVLRFGLHEAWNKYLTRFPPDDANS